MSRSARPKAWIRSLVVLMAIAVVPLPLSGQQHQESSEEPARSNREISATEIATAQNFGQSIGIAEWLGPLAPVALSPFFGITCMAAMSQFGGDWISADNPLLGEGSPLHKPVVFWTFLVLTILTSLPRLTKVSKPFAQAVDQVEAWAGIITMVTMKILLATQSPETEEVVAVQLGFVGLTVNTLLIIAAMINIFVINSVKFFFETLIWLTPIPSVDAVFECANKFACGALMLIYGMSPTIATVINLVILAISLVVFRWVYRREVFFRTMLLDGLWAMLFKVKRVGPAVVVFPVSETGPFPARTRCTLTKTDAGWAIVQNRMLRTDVLLEIPKEGSRVAINSGYFTNAFEWTGHLTARFTFSRWYNGHLDELAQIMGASVNRKDAATLQNQSTLRAELS